MKITPGVKYASYTQSFNHLQDCSTVGGLGATVSPATTGPAVCTITSGVGAASVSNSVTYTDVLPALDVHYQLQKNWAAYAQYAVGDQIPDTGVFDVKNAQVLTPPVPTKSRTYQAGSVYQSDAFTMDADIYYTTLDNAYTVVVDPTTLLNLYPLIGNQYSKGIEVESNIMLGKGYSLYVNGTSGSTKYSTGQWVAGAPSDTETLGFNYADADWSASLQVKRVGAMYNDGTDANKNVVHEAFQIDPAVLTNLFVNYTVKNPVSFSKQAKLQLSVNNLFDQHNIVGVAGGVAGSTSANPNVADLLTVLPARSVSLTAKLDF